MAVEISGKIAKVYADKFLIIEMGIGERFGNVLDFCQLAADEKFVAFRISIICKLLYIDVQEKRTDSCL